MARFAYSTNAYTKFSLTDAILDIGRLGFEGVEILADVPHAFPGSVDPVEISEALRQSGLSISNLNANTSLGLDREGRDPDGFWPGFLDPDPAVRRMRIDYVKGAIDLARAVGAKNVCTASGRLPDGVSPDIAAKLLDEAMAELLDYAERGPPVRIGIEAEPGFFIGDGRAAMRLLEKHPVLGVNLVIGHVV